MDTRAAVSNIYISIFSLAFISVVIPNSSYLRAQQLSNDVSAWSAYDWHEAYKKGNSIALNKLKELDNNGNNDAAYWLGVIYRDGEGVQRDPETAIAYFQRCIIVGDFSNICENALDEQYNSRTFSQGEEKFYLDASERANEFTASRMLQRIGKRGSSEAIRRLEIRANQGERYAAAALGAIYEKRVRSAQDITLAAKWYKRCADLGKNTFFCNEELTRLYARLCTNPVLDPDASKWLFAVAKGEREVLNFPPQLDKIKAAECGYALNPTPSAAVALADVYYQQAHRIGSVESGIAMVGKGFDVDPRPDRHALAADAFYSLGARGNFEAALRNAAIHYESDRETLTAPQSARLAFMKLTGRGAMKNREGALEVFKHAAAKGDKAAQNTVEWLTKAVLDNETGESDLTETTSYTVGVCEAGGINVTEAIQQHFEFDIRVWMARGLPPKVSLDDVTTNLYALMPSKKNSALVVFARDFDQHCAWVIDKTGVKAFESIYGPSNAISEGLAGFHQAIGIVQKQLDRSPARIGRSNLSKRTVRALKSGFGSVSAGEAEQELSKLVFPGDTRDIVKQYSVIILATYGTIGAIPFYALQDRSGQEFVETTSFIIASSLLELALPPRFAPKTSPITSPTKPKGEAQNQLSALIVGNPQPIKISGWKFPALPGAEAEAREVASLFETTPLIGPHATVFAVENRSHDAGVLYFATHAVAVTGSAKSAVDNSFLALADGAWTARRIQEMRLQANLAVLSACQTGLGYGQDGGIIGIARAFQVAGVAQVIMSLWSIDDEATRYLMVSFMKRRNSVGAAEALRAAMAQARDKYRDPSLWAGFGLFGVPPLQ